MATQPQSTTKGDSKVLGEEGLRQGGHGTSIPTGSQAPPSQTTYTDRLRDRLANCSEGVLIYS